MISSYGPNLSNLRLSLSHLMSGRDKLRTKGLGTKMGRIRIRNYPFKKMKISSPQTVGLPKANSFGMHSFTSQLPGAE